MKTRHFLAGLFFAGIFGVNAQTNTHTSTISSLGWQAGALGSGNTFYGPFAGNSTTATGTSNTFLGFNTGKVNTTGNSNLFAGNSAGVANTTGAQNTFLGVSSGAVNTGGALNIFIGYLSGNKTQTGNSNVYIGSQSATVTSTANNNGSNNTYIGTASGVNNTGSNNVFIGYAAGYSASLTSVSDRLAIDNTVNTTPLIWGDFNSNRLVFNGKVGITQEALADQSNLFPNTAGTVNVNDYQLFVKGGILTEAIRVAQKSPSNWADYVFADGYELASLEEVECFIDENGHLPNVPSAKQLSEDGIELAEMSKIQQEKIEELTLYIIDQNKQLKEQDLKIQELEKKYAEVEELKAALKVLIDKK